MTLRPQLLSRLGTASCLPAFRRTRRRGLSIWRQCDAVEILEETDEHEGRFVIGELEERDGVNRGLFQAGAWPHLLAEADAGPFVLKQIGSEAPEIMH